MGYKWENVTSDMNVSTCVLDDGLELTLTFNDRAREREQILFVIDSEDVYPFSKRQAVHTKYDDRRMYAYLLKKPSGNLKELLNDSEFRLSVPLCLPHGNFSRLTDLKLERRVEAPDWEEITSQCKPTLMKSMSSAGFYVKLTHKGTPVALLGAHRNGAMMAQGSGSKYKVEKADNATISFHVFMKNKE